MKETPKTPSAFLSLLPLIVLVLMLVATVRAYGSDSLSGASQVTLLVVSAFCVLIGMCFLKVPWKKFEEAIVFNITNVATAVIILLLIGALSGAWMVSGVVPSLIYYGVQIIHPDVFFSVFLHHQRHGQCHDWQFVDNHRHHRHCPHGHRSCAGIRRRMDCRGHHQRSLFR